MCGIFGAVNADGFFSPEMRSRFTMLSNSTSYRGPDDWGVLALAMKADAGAASDRFDVFLGNRRLAILDLTSNGHQPMTDGGGRWIAYNGEIFNYLELRKELELRGHRFHTDTDTEVILHIYDEYGDAGFERMNGMWALAIADVPKKRIVLSRDRFSIKPLYLLRTGGCTYFASEIKQLLPLLPTRRLNEGVMLEFLSQGLLDHTASTFFEGITKVPPRTSITISLEDGSWKENTYWKYSQVPERSSPREAVQRFRELFLDSIRLRLRSDVKVGVLLSGGLDSSAIAVGSQLLSSDAIDTYSIVSSDGLSDEHEFIDALSSTGIRNHKIVFESQDVTESLGHVLEHSDEPVGGLSVVAQFKLFEAIRRQADATVLLSGQGGDEVLLGYLKFFFFYLRVLYQQGRYLQALMQLSGSVRERTVVRQFNLPTARRYIPALGAGLRDAVRPRHVAVRVWECEDVASRQIADIEFYSVPALTHYEDRNSMAHSLEVRHPFLDHRLVDFLIGLPPESKIQNGWTKHVLREAFPELPAAIRWRRDKQGFLTPEKRWLKQDLSGPIRATFQGRSRLAQAGIVDDSKFMNYYEQFQRGAAVSESDIARFFIAEQWMQRMF